MVYFVEEIVGLTHWDFPNALAEMERLMIN